jgi:HK97 family phage major capsid protein
VENLSPEVTKAVGQILEAMKKRDAEVAEALKKVETDIKATDKVQEGTKEALAKLTTTGQELHTRLKDIEAAIARGEDGTRNGKKKGPGDLMVEDAEFVKFAKDAAVSSTNWKGQHRFGVKTITSLAASAGDGVWSDQRTEIIEGPLRPLSIRDLLDVGTTNSNLIEWVQELLFTNNADVVSEGTLKPESNITYDRKSTPVVTIAHWIRATKQILADFPQLASLINGRLRWGLKIKEEDQLLYGDGTAGNLLGIVPQATPYNTALNTAGDTMIDTVRHAMLQVRLAFYPASGVVLSPIDWHYIELTKDNENRYLMASPTSRAPAMLWGLPVVESDGMHAGNFLVGAFRLAATILDREDAAILVSTEDQDNFVKNLVTILCEERLALLVVRPAAFVFGGFPAGATT